MNYARKAWGIAAYAFQAEIICPDCTRQIAMHQADMTPGEGVTIGDALCTWAAMLGIDPEDEHSFDSGDFPKVVFSSDIESTEYCGQCHELID